MLVSQWVQWCEGHEMPFTHLQWSTYECSNKLCLCVYVCMVSEVVPSKPYVIKNRNVKRKKIKGNVSSEWTSQRSWWFLYRAEVQNTPTSIHFFYWISEPNHRQLNLSTMKTEKKFHCVAHFRFCQVSETKTCLGGRRWHQRFQQWFGRRHEPFTSWKYRQQKYFYEKVNFINCVTHQSLPLPYADPCVHKFPIILSSETVYINFAWFSCCVAHPVHIRIPLKTGLMMREEEIKVHCYSDHVRDKCLNIVASVPIAEIKTFAVNDTCVKLRSGYKSGFGIETTTENGFTCIWTLSSVAILLCANFDMRNHLMYGVSWECAL